MESREGAETRRVVRIELTPRGIVTAVVAATAIYLAWRLSTVLIVLIVSFILAAALAPYVRRLEAHGARRPVAVGVVFLATAAATTLIGGLIVPPLFDQMAQLVANAPAIQAHATRFLASHAITAPLARSLGNGSQSEMVVGVLRSVVAYSPRLVELLLYAVTTVFLSFYLLLDRDRVRGAAYALVPKAYHVRFARIVSRLQVIVGGYVRGQVITSGLMTIVVFAVLTVCRVPNAVALAVFGGLADVLPYIGPVLTVVPAVVAALPRGTGIALIVLGVLLVYEEIESRVVIPRVYGRALRLPSSAVIVALLAGGALMGIVGALLALPIAAALRMLVEELRVELPGDDRDASEVRLRDERAERTYEALSRGAPAGVAAKVAERIAEQVHGKPGDEPPAPPAPGAGTAGDRDRR